MEAQVENATLKVGPDGLSQRGQGRPQISRGREPRAAKEACGGFASRPGAALRQRLT